MYHEKTTAVAEFFLNIITCCIIGAVWAWIMKHTDLLDGVDRYNDSDIS